LKNISKVSLNYCNFVFFKVTKTLKLNNGKECPVVGLGTGGYRAGGPPQGEVVKQMIHNAIDSGYRHFDTSSSYMNEKAIGQAINEVINEEKVKREDIFLTTKIFGRHSTEVGLNRGKNETLDNIHLALQKLNLTYIDLMLIHSPSNDSETNSETWTGLEEAVNQGLVKSIGVSNFNIEQLTSLLKTAKMIPAMNQVESHPKVNQKELLDYCSKHGIHLTAYSPLGAGNLITDPTIVEIGKKHNKSAAQVMIRWQIQRGVVAIPKSTKKERIKENIEVFDFSLTDDEMKTLENMN
jgi:diketogulonate reductase-like aldo/keto reductase